MNAHAREVAAIIEVVTEHFLGSYSTEDIARMTASFEAPGPAGIYLIQKMGWKGREAKDAARQFANLGDWPHSSVRERITRVKYIMEDVFEVPF